MKKKKSIFNKKDDINFDDDLFGKMGNELEDDSSFDISVGESGEKEAPKKHAQSKVEQTF